MRTVVLGLQRDELGLQGPFGGGAIHTEVDVCEQRQLCSCEPTATPDASGHDVVGTFLHVLQFFVPGGGIRPHILSSVESSLGVLRVDVQSTQ